MMKHDLGKRGIERDLGGDEKETESKIRKAIDSPERGEKPGWRHGREIARGEWEGKANCGLFSRAVVWPKMKR